MGKKSNKLNKKEPCKCEEAFCDWKIADPTPTEGRQYIVGCVEQDTGADQQYYSTPIEWRMPRYCPFCGLPVRYLKYRRHNLKIPDGQWEEWAPGKF
jgi:hypothetical protein